VLAASVAKAVILLRQLYQQKEATGGEAVAAHDEQVQLPDDQQDEVTLSYS
jgi:negative regulator of sigma E activity